jgi:integrase
MTRKTFATNMLRANNRLDDISNALGHTNPSTAEVYLERDENDMRLCPLNFGGIWS